MRIVISACTHRAFSDGPLPLAHLRLRQLVAVNENAAQPKVKLGIDRPHPPGSTLAFHTKRMAYGRVELIIVVLALVAGSVAMPLLQGFAVPIMTTSEQRPEVFRGSPIAPALQSPQENG